MRFFFSATILLLSTVFFPHAHALSSFIFLLCFPSQYIRKCTWECERNVMYPPILLDCSVFIMIGCSTLGFPVYVHFSVQLLRRSLLYARLSFWPKEKSYFASERETPFGSQYEQHRVFGAHCSLNTVLYMMKTHNIWHFSSDFYLFFCLSFFLLHKMDTHLNLSQFEALPLFNVARLGFRRDLRAL